MVRGGFCFGASRTCSSTENTPQVSFKFSPSPIPAAAQDIGRIAYENRIWALKGALPERPGTGRIRYFILGTFTTFARQSRRFWQAIGFKSFVMQKETAVR